MKKILALIDCQKDFIDGSMGVGLEKWNPAKAEILKLVEANHYDKFIVTKDWHPANHSSFKDEGGLWPAHCVAMTDGAELDSDIDSMLSSEDDVLYIKKGMEVGKEEYGVDLLQFEKENAEVDVVGLCYDYCVASCAKMTSEAHPNSKVTVMKAGTVAIDSSANPDFGKANVQ